MNPFDTETIEMLQRPLDASLIKHRPGGKGMMLKYLSGHDVIQAANRLFGFGAWGYKVVGRGHEVITDGKKGPLDVYTCDIELQVQGAAFPFPGDGVGIVNPPYTAESHEQARKSATTDALKRALRHYGDSFGLCLYDEDDYVDAGDGTLMPVKDVRPQMNGQAQPKRIVDSQAPTMLTTRTTSNDSAHNGKALPASTQSVSVASEGQVNVKNVQAFEKARFTALYQAGKKAGLIDKEGWTGLFEWASRVVEREIKQPGDLSALELQSLEYRVKESEAAHV